MSVTKQSMSFNKFAHINVETLCAELLANGLTFDQLRLKKEGAFKKLYRKDVGSVVFDEDDNGRQVVDISVTRDSIYDTLPEGLFHQPTATNIGLDTSKMVADSRRLKEEEKSARLFFQPFDQEMIAYATQVEQQERYLMQKILMGNLSDDPYEFWDIPKNIPLAQATMLTGLLPWAYLIKGNLDLTAKALQMILGRKISVVEKWITDQGIEKTPRNMEDMFLGEDSAIGNHFLEGGIAWVFSIHQIPLSEMILFLNKSHFGALLDLFTDIFLPIEIEVQFDYLADAENDGTTENILGYGFVI